MSLSCILWKMDDDDDDDGDDDRNIGVVQSNKSPSINVSYLLFHSPFQSLPPSLPLSLLSTSSSHSNLQTYLTHIAVALSLATLLVRSTSHSSVSLRTK